MYQIIEKKNHLCVCVYERVQTRICFYLTMMMIIEWLINREIPMYLERILTKQKMHVDMGMRGKPY